MRFVSWKKDGEQGLAMRRGKDLVKLTGFDMLGLLRAGKEGLERAAAQAASAPVLDPTGLEYLPPIANPPKIACVGMNYQDHADENKIVTQDYPTFFIRFTQSLLGHEQPMLRPKISDTLDFEGELAVIIGKPGRYISKENALDHVWGYALFNDGSVREFQSRGKQWTLGKNFDRTGGFGPELITADELPPGGKGLHLETRLNGEVVQSANTSDLIFDIPTLISRLSEATSLEVGDVIVTGTPAGIGFFRKPPLYMKTGDVCEVEIEKVGILRNPIADEA